MQQTDMRLSAKRAEVRLPDVVGLLTSSRFVRTRLVASAAGRLSTALAGVERDAAGRVLNLARLLRALSPCGLRA